MKKLSTLTFAFLTFIVIFVTHGCAGGAQASVAPALITPTSVQEDTARVTRGNVERVEMYKGIVRTSSVKLYYENTNLRFGEYHVMTGDRVVEGQLLAKLETKYIEEQIENHEKHIARLIEQYDYENEIAEIDLAIMRVELSDILELAASFDEYAMDLAEIKKLDIERRRMHLEQSIERQELSLYYERQYLNEMLLNIEDAELRAPFDGVVTFMTQKSPGDWMEPFAGLIYLSDGSDAFVEYASMGSINVFRGSIVRGTVGDSVYEMERIYPTTQEFVYYSTMRLTPPTRFAVKNPDENFTPGAYVAVYVYSAIVEDVLRVPSNSVYVDSDIGAYVYIMENGTKTMRQIEQGLRAEAFIEVRAGLEEGDVIFVRQ